MKGSLNLPKFPLSSLGFYSISLRVLNVDITTTFFTILYNLSKSLKASLRIKGLRVFTRNTYLKLDLKGHYS